VPHLHIPGITETPTRLHIDGARRAFKAAVFCNSVAGVFIFETTGTSYPGCKTKKKYQTKKGKEMKEASAFTGQEYLDAVKAAMQHFERTSAWRAARRMAGTVMLVHDKSRIHTAAAVTEGLKRMEIEAVVQPARSPDLMPLDYGIFGTAKNEEARRRPLHASWEVRVELFKEILLNSAAAATIGEFPLRAEACIASNGQHFLKALNDVKCARSAAGRR